jgi:hypothetical protein
MNYPGSSNPSSNFSDSTTPDTTLSNHPTHITPSHDTPSHIIDVSTPPNSIEFGPIPEIPHRDWPIHECIDHFQMMVPPGINPDWYFHVSYPEYARVLTRSIDHFSLNLNTLKQMSVDERRWLLLTYTDRELLDAFEILPAYSTRSELVTTLAERMDLNGFFIPLAIRCRNDKTTLLSYTREPGLVLIGYGTVLSYWGYEIDELRGAFYPEGSPGGPIIYRRPDRPQKIWSVEEMRDLYRLLGSLPGSEALRYHLHQSFLRDPDNGSTELIDTFIHYSEEQKHHIELWLQLLFETAMYMRRWEGPGHPYPLRSYQTHVNDLPDVAVSQGLINLDQLTTTFDVATQNFIRALREVRHYQTTQLLGRYVVTTLPLTRILERIQNEEECIRMASSDLIISTNYYHELLFGSSFPDFEVSELQHIT